MQERSADPVTDPSAGSPTQPRGCGRTEQLR